MVEMTIEIISSSNKNRFKLVHSTSLFFLNDIKRKAIKRKGGNVPIRHGTKSRPIAISYLQNQVIVHPLSLPAGAAIKQETFKYNTALRGKINKRFPFPSITNGQDKYDNLIIQFHLPAKISCLSGGWNHKTLNALCVIKSYLARLLQGNVFLVLSSVVLVSLQVFSRSLQVECMVKGSGISHTFLFW